MTKTARDNAPAATGATVTSINKTRPRYTVHAEELVDLAARAAAIADALNGFAIAPETFGDLERFAAIEATKVLALRVRQVIV